MMTSPVAGIDLTKTALPSASSTATVSRSLTPAFPNSAIGFVEAIELLTTNRVSQVGVEGSASWGAHVAIAIVAAGFDAREVPPQRSARKR